MVGAMAGAKANEDEVSDSMIIDRQISYFTYREGINEQHTRLGIPVRVFRAGLESDQPHVIRRIGLYDGQLLGQAFSIIAPT